ncbi:MAG: T9SS type A sorting domain-containing protein, partial [Bacteroidales bacterium]|nr:T9SS type A sorting domain-containing protein [Bacteroidales bacterium]
VAVYDLATYGDFDISLKAKVNKIKSGALDPLADFIIAFGYEDGSNYSYMRFTGEDINGFYGVDTSGAVEVGELNTTPAISDTMYHDYRLVRSGTTVTAYVDGVEYMSVTDDALGTEGKIGVGSYNDIAIFDDFVEGEPSSVAEMQSVGFTLYPNPATDKVFIKAEDQIQRLTIRNIIGQEITSLSKLKSGLIEVNTSHLEAGIYFITVQALNGGFCTQKFIIR